MAEKREEIDLTTLQEFERLLTSTEFATVDDLLARGPVDVPPVAPKKDDSQAPDAIDGTPLPKRR